MLVLAIITARQAVAHNQLLYFYEREVLPQPELLEQTQPEDTDLFPVNWQGHTYWKTAGQIAVAVAIREGSITHDGRFKDANRGQQVCGIKATSHLYKRFENPEDGIRSCSDLLSRYLTRGYTKDDLDYTLQVWKNGNRSLSPESKIATDKYIQDIKWLLINGGN